MALTHLPMTPQQSVGTLCIPHRSRGMITVRGRLKELMLPCCWCVQPFVTEQRLSLRAGGSGTRNGTHRVAQRAAFFLTKELEPWSSRSTSGLRSRAISALRPRSSLGQTHSSWPSVVDVDHPVHCRWNSPNCIICCTANCTAERGPFADMPHRWQGAGIGIMNSGHRHLISVLVDPCCAPADVAEGGEGQAHDVLVAGLQVLLQTVGDQHQHLLPLVQQDHEAQVPDPLHDPADVKVKVANGLHSCPFLMTSCQYDDRDWVSKRSQCKYHAAFPSLPADGKLQQGSIHGVTVIWWRCLHAAHAMGGRAPRNDHQHRRTACCWWFMDPGTLHETAWSYRR